MIARGINVQELCLAEAPGVMAHDSNGIYFIDSLFFDDLAEFLRIQKANQLVFLILHHLPEISETSIGADSARAIKGPTRTRLLSLSGCLVTSVFTQELLVHVGLPIEHILTVAPALCIKPDSAEKYTMNTGQALMVANLIELKGILEFLEDIQGLLTNEDNFRLIIVGRHDMDKAYAHRCIQFVKDHPELERKIIFTGPLSSEKLREMYSESALFISVSKMETFGMALMEARAFGIYILALERGHVSAHVDKDYGHLYQNSKTLAYDFVQLMRDPVRLASFRQKPAKPEIEIKYDWNDATVSFIDQLSRLIKSSL